MSRVHVGEGNKLSVYFQQSQAKQSAGLAQNCIKGRADGASISVVIDRKDTIRQMSPIRDTLSDGGDQVDAEEENSQEQARRESIPFEHGPDSSDFVGDSLGDIISGILRQTESMIANLQPAINEMENTADDIKRELLQKQETVTDRRKELEDIKDRFQQAATSVLEMLNVTVSMPELEENPSN
ncbi:hypothetical protein KP509_16G032500 [Ceratopteris richardii]|uniref:Uncharacterized protein n=1 Tax=Ceratopteris richardii TaxID=49495 RepID=A0A8T2T3E4_CERRI|nr:hypothetical protein KP509_16G032500 [Ceratopteris richardii]